MQSYQEFLDLSVGFPQDGFDIIDDELYFNDLNLMELIETYGTPLRFTYVPLISKKIQQAKLLFQKGIVNNNYRGRYIYTYCTKSSHFRHVVEEALKNDIHLETSSAFDMPMIDALEKKGVVSKDVYVICNGFKTSQYKQYIVDMIHDGFTNIMPVLDNKEEFYFYDDELDQECNLGIRIASEEQPDSQFYTSRLGIRAEDIIDFYHNRIEKNPNFKIKMLHFFINSGIQDSPYYWNELEKYVTLFCKFKKINPDLTMLDIGGGFPFKDSLVFDFDYEYMTNEIIKRIKEICSEHDVEEPDIVTEFGKYTVAEASGILYKVLGRKQQNDRERWLMLDGSFITNLPDVWALNQKYILLPINNWDAEYERVNLGGITCDGQDYYNQEAHMNSVYMPKTRKVQYLGFFHTGAYQDVLSGYGGIHHCLMPTPKHILIRRNRDETFNYEVFGEEQNSKQVMKLLGYA
ncbi:type III PLP-dependent enzyme domain-containing protein [Solitalea koreensis]|uniref:Arginine decarboxylase n=1 Tax=Solitalea koreensis TaxID=543615 RepID=A0A521BHC8_9SPHI|nr:arginine decarboxylase [Solitalea koreensis]SMO46446.1 arginine decarboxylase [Solitalea koreensis]